jgi:hypothetical protein
MGRGGERALFAVQSQRSGAEEERRIGLRGRKAEMSTTEVVDAAPGEPSVPLSGKALFRNLHTREFLGHKKKVCVSGRPAFVSLRFFNSPVLEGARWQLEDIKLDISDR